MPAVMTPEEREALARARQQDEWQRTQATRAQEAFVHDREVWLNDALDAIDATARSQDYLGVVVVEVHEPRRRFGRTVERTAQRPGWLLEERVTPFAATSLWLLTDGRLVRDGRIVPWDDYLRYRYPELRFHLGQLAERLGLTLPAAPP
jgi:hypothetical protein